MNWMIVSKREFAGKDERIRELQAEISALKKESERLQRRIEGFMNLLLAKGTGMAVPIEEPTAEELRMAAERYMMIHGKDEIYSAEDVAKQAQFMEGLQS